jgi:Ca-activated chloride channel family protein
MLAALSGVSAQSAGPRVELNLIVTDKDNKSVNTIKKEDIHVFEDKVEQTVVTLEADERPVDCILAIDASGSFRSFLGAALQATQLLVQNRRPADEIAIERFISSDKIDSLCDFTTDGKALIESLRLFKIEGGQSAVIDGLYVAVDAVSEHNKSSGDRRKAVVLISDGEDRNSFYKIDALLKRLRQRNAQVFVIGITMDLNKEAGLVMRSPRERAEKLLTSVAQDSGGRTFFVRDGKQLVDATAQIINHLRTQFRVTYISSNGTKPGFRKTEVKLSSPNGEKRTAIVAPGYYVAAPTTAAQPKDQKTP